METVFRPLNFNDQEAKAIYEHEQFGWDRVEKFLPWVRMTLK